MADPTRSWLSREDQVGSAIADRASGREQRMERRLHGARDAVSKVRNGGPYEELVVARGSK